MFSASCRGREYTVSIRVQKYDARRTNRHCSDHAFQVSATVACCVSLRWCLGGHSVEKDRGKGIGRFLFGQGDEVGIVKVHADCVIVHRAQKSLYSDIGVPVIEDPFSLPVYDVLAEKSEQRADLAADVFFG